MNGNCHFVFGAALGTAVAINMDKIQAVLPNLEYSANTTTLFVLGGIVGGIFPDIDNPTSYMGKLSAPVSKWIAAVGEMFGKTGVYHRGLMHDAAVYIAGMVLSYLYCPSLCGFFLGCLSHIFLDMFNPVGVPFLLGTRHLHLGKIKSGSRESVALTWICVAVTTAAGIITKTGTYFLG